MRHASRNLTTEAIARARSARKNPSVAEEIAWQFLKANRTGFHFRREVSIGDYRVDFYCAEAKLAVEFDGEQHDPNRDAERDTELKKAGIEVFRVPNVRFFQIDHPGAEDHIRQIVELCEARSGRRAEEKEPRRSRKAPHPLP